MDKKTTVLKLFDQYAGIDGGHHKQWVIDQAVRILTACPLVSRVSVDISGRVHTYEARGESEEYVAWVRAYCAGEDGSDMYVWDVGTPP